MKCNDRDLFPGQQPAVLGYVGVVTVVVAEPGDPGVLLAWSPIAARMLRTGVSVRSAQ